MKHDFTKKQWEGINDLLEWMQMCNTHSECTFKLSNITFYKDGEKNFFVSYYKSGYEGGEMVGHTQYAKVNSFGEKTEYERFPIDKLEKINFE